jgi:arylsulfatase A-like enzyme
MNILLILSDDHAAWALAQAGCPELQTPNFERLCAGGLRHTQAMTPCPVCSPARASLMTGLMPSEHGIHDWLQEYDADIGDKDWLEDKKTLPQQYQEKGYFTALSGKWHLGFHEGPPPGFDRAFGMDRKINTHNGTIDYYLDGEKQTLVGNRSRQITDHALRFLQQRPSEKPFFLNVGYFATHSPFDENKHDPALVQLYRNATFPAMPRRPPHPWRKSENGLPGEAFDEGEARKRWRGYFAAVTEIDREVGRLLTALDDHGLAEDTLVIYTADHGLCLGHHGVWGKGNGTRPLNLYETSLRVPLILRGPGLPAGAVDERPLTHCDLHHLLQQLADPDARETALGGWPHQPDDPHTFHEYGDMRAIRTPRYKLIRRHGRGPDELFNLIQDPDECENLMQAGEHKTLVGELNSKLEAFFTTHSREATDGLHVAFLPRHNDHEAWR